MPSYYFSEVIFEQGRPDWRPSVKSRLAQPRTATGNIVSFKEKVAFNLAHWSKQPWPARSAAAHLLAKSGLAEWFSYRRNGMVIRMRSSGLARLLWADPGKRLDGELFLSRFLKNADAVVDVGANTGILTHLASIMVGCRGMVMAIEAHPRTHEALLENLRLNRLTNVVPMNCAVDPHRGVRLSPQHVLPGLNRATSRD